MVCGNGRGSRGFSPAGLIEVVHSEAVVLGAPFQSESIANLRPDQRTRIASIAASSVTTARSRSQHRSLESAPRPARPRPATRAQRTIAAKTTGPAVTRIRDRFVARGWGQVVSQESRGTTARRARPRAVWTEQPLASLPALVRGADQDPSAFKVVAADPGYGVAVRVPTMVGWTLQ
jgi:hypothetical protein